MLKILKINIDANVLQNPQVDNDSYQSKQWF